MLILKIIFKKLKKYYFKKLKILLKRLQPQYHDCAILISKAEST